MPDEAKPSRFPKNVRKMSDDWKALAKKIGCQLHGFDNERQASFVTPDGYIFEVSTKYRAILETFPDRDIQQ